jgi:ABC-type transport system involved in multi-copper enzyme maturation permease subunit
MPPVVRIIWKESRTQWSLWLSLLVGTLLLQSLFFLFLQETQRQMPHYPLSIAFVLVNCYVAACAAILFGGEREAETDRLLRQFPVGLATLIAGKFLFALGAIALLMLLTCATGLAIPMSFGLAIPLREHVDPKDPVLVMALAGVSLFVWVMLASLLLKGVLVALVAGAMATVLAAGLSVSLFRTWIHPFMVGMAAGVLLIDLLLIRLWWRDGLSVERLRERLVSWFRTATSPYDLPSRGRLERERGETRHGSQSRGTRRERWWFRRLDWAVNRPTPGGRIVSVLLWRELRTVVPFLLLWGLVGIVFVDLLMRWGWIGLGDIPFHLFFLLLTPLVCGVMAFWSDQRAGTYRFLAERGASPTTVWVCKQLVWGLLAAAIVTGFGAYDLLMHSEPFGLKTATSAYEPAVSILANAVHLRVSHMPHDVVILATAPASFLMTLFMCLYALGQFLSFSLRRTLLAVSLGLLAIPFIYLWNWLMLQLDVPLWLSVWPLTLATLAGTWRLCDGWMKGTGGRRRSLVKLAWLAVPVLLILAVLPGQRVWSVPHVEPGFDWQAHEQRLQQVDLEWSAQWQSLFQDLEMLGSTRRNQLRESEAVQGRIHSAQETLRTLAAALDDSRTSAPLDPLMGYTHPGGMIGVVMSEAVEEHLQAGRLDAAWEDLEAGLQVTHYLANQSTTWRKWMTCQAVRRRILADVRHWAQAEEITQEQLQRAARFLADQPPPDPSQMLINRYVMLRQVFERREPAWSRMLEAVPELAVLDRFPLSQIIEPELRRSVRVLNAVTEQWGKRVYGTVPAEVSRAEWRMLVTTLPYNFGLPPGIAYEMAPPEHWWSDLWQLAMAEERGTLLALELERHRLREGEYPPRLEMLLGEVLTELPLCPFSEQPFGYEPSGLPAPAVISSSSVVPANQPLLWSRGRGAGDLIYSPGPFPPQVDSPLPERMYWASNINWPSGHNHIPQQLTQEQERLVRVISQKLEQLDEPDGQVRFVILGETPVPAEH